MNTVLQEASRLSFDNAISRIMAVNEKAFIASSGNSISTILVSDDIEPVLRLAKQSTRDDCVLTCSLVGSSGSAMQPRLCSLEREDGTSAICIRNPLDSQALVHRIAERTLAKSVSVRRAVLLSNDKLAIGYRRRTHLQSALSHLQLPRIWTCHDTGNRSHHCRNASDFT